MIDHEKLKEEIGEIEAVNEKMAKQIMLEFLSITQIYMTLTDLKQFLSIKLFEDIKVKLEKWIAEEFPTIDGWSNKKINIAYQNIIDSTKFYISINEQGTFDLRRFSSEDDENFTTLNQEDISYMEFSFVLKRALETYIRNIDLKNIELGDEEEYKLLKYASYKISNRITLDMSHKLEMLQEMPSNEQIQTILLVISITEILLDISDLEQMFLPKTYKALRKKLERIILEECPENDGWNGEKIEELRQDIEEQEKFVIQYEGKEKFVLKRDGDIEAFAEINPNEILIDDLMNTAKTLMEKYKELDNMKPTILLTEDEILLIVNATIKNIMKENRIKTDPEDNKNILKKIKNIFM